MYDETKSGNSRDISNFLNYRPSLNISEECFPDQDDEVFSYNEKMNLKAEPKKDSKISVILPKVDSFSKMPVNKIKETTNVDKISDKNANFNQEKPSVPYDPSLVLEIYKKNAQNESKKPVINVITIGNCLHRVNSTNISFSGHVDAGKSTLMGNMLCQMKYVSDRKLAKYKHEAQKAGKASFAYAWILDESVEERSRGITTDVAQTFLETNNRKVTSFA